MGAESGLGFLQIATELPFTAYTGFCFFVLPGVVFVNWT